MLRNMTSRTSTHALLGHTGVTQALLCVATFCPVLFPEPAAAATRTYIVTDYDSIRVEGPMNVNVVTGRGASAKGEGGRDALDALDLQVNSRVLVVRFRKTASGAPNQGNIGGVNLLLTTPALKRVYFTGSGTVSADGLSKGDAEITAAGTGRVTISGIATDSLLVSQTGAGTVSLAGRAKNARIRASGNGSIEAGALQVNDLTLAINGAATVEAHADRAAQVSLVGSGSATVNGRPACTVRQAGGGVVRCGAAGR
jgi:hypothetical protein